MCSPSYRVNLRMRCECRLRFSAARSMNRGAMNLERGIILFNRTIDQCRNIGRRGGRARARNLRARKASHVAAVPAATQSEDETARTAIERIDALCPWLKGCELRATG